MKISIKSGNQLDLRHFNQYIRISLSIHRILMQRIVPFLFIVAILSTGCPRPEPEVRKVEIGLFTPYSELPDFLNGKGKEVVERNYLAVEQDGEYVKGERLSMGVRDSITWANDFRVKFDENSNLLQCDLIERRDDIQTGIHL